jgi:pimeloyl-ACP methyl ester carboxylesterase
MKNIYYLLSLFCLLMFQSVTKAQLSPTSSPYYANGSYSIVSDSTTVSSKKVVIYRPSTPPSGDKYPVFIFQPGANGFFSSAITVHSYDLYLKHLATYGYVVLVIDETSAGLPNGTTFIAVHDWFITNVANTSHWLYTYADSSIVVIGGHSNGGVNASGCLVDSPNQIKGIVYFASYPSNNFMVPQDVSGYTGKVLDLSGAADATSTPASCRTGYDAFTSANCAYWVSITGMDHGGFGDYVNTSQPVGAIGRTNATATVRHYLVSFMESQYKNNTIALANFQTSLLQPNTTATFENSCVATNIDETEIAAEVKVFPNPASDYVTITIAGEITESDIMIFDMAGRIITDRVDIEAQDVNEYKLDLSNIDNGYYFVSFAGRKISPIRFAVAR